jgi:oligopeptide/dipeptide ABC transporter ATP-binding protein
MNAGEIVEAGTASDVFDNTIHPYTRALLDAVPGARRRKKTLAAVGTVDLMEGK